MSSATRLKDDTTPAEVSVPATRGARTFGDQFATRRWISAAGLLGLDLLVFVGA